MRHTRASNKAVPSAHMQHRTPWSSPFLVWAFTLALAVIVGLNGWRDDTMPRTPGNTAARAQADINGLPVLEGIPATETQDLLGKQTPQEVSNVSRFLGQLFEHSLILDTIAKRQRYITEKALKSADATAVTSALQHWQAAIEQERSVIMTLPVPHIDNDIALQQVRAARKALADMAELLAQQPAQMTHLSSYSLDDAKKIAQQYDDSQTRLIHAIDQTYISYGYTQTQLNSHNPWPALAHTAGQSGTD